MRQGHGWLLESPEILIHFIIGPPGPEQWVFFIDIQPLFKLDLFGVQQPLVVVCTDLQPFTSSQKPKHHAPSNISVSGAKQKIASLVINATVFADTRVTFPPSAYISFEDGTHALWAAVTAGTRLGLLQLDCVLLGVMRVLRAGFFKYKATSAAQHALACLQSRERLKHRVQQLMTSREEPRLAAANRMQASKMKAALVRAADLQEAQAFRTRSDAAEAEPRRKLQQAMADKDAATQELRRMRAEAAAVEGQRQAAEQLATNTQTADKLAADMRAAQLQESLDAARAATVQAVEGLGIAEKAAAAAKAESEKAQVYSSKLKAMLEKALRNDKASQHAKQLQQDSDAAKAETAAARAETVAANAKAATAEAQQPRQRLLAQLLAFASCKQQLMHPHM
ncbi:TPA: hypothetical protein ACH3X3_000604 [Trebouxia sp. C0006]